MGLDLTPQGLDYGHPDHERLHARWSYSGFHKFRELLAYALGFEYRKIGPATCECSNDLKAHESGLFDLFMHSDCDGELTPEQCRQIGPALRGVLDGHWSPAEEYQ